MGARLTCNDNKRQWVLPFAKMGDPEVMARVHEVLANGTKVCFCNNRAVQAQPHHTAVSRLSPEPTSPSRAFGGPFSTDWLT